MPAEAGVVGAGAALWLVAVGWEVLELGCGLWGVGPAFGASPGEKGRTAAMPMGYVCHLVCSWAPSVP